MLFDIQGDSQSHGAGFVPKISRERRFAILRDVAATEQQEFVGRMKSVDDRYFAPQRRFLDERTRHQQAGEIEKLLSARIVDTDQQSALNEREMPAQRDRLRSRIDRQQELRRILLASLRIGEASRNQGQVSFRKEICVDDFSYRSMRSAAQ
ncbi:MAG: hypothetical protein F9K41_11400 [Sphingopyxis terrae]|nr:MAG: hypothetical protein F9K41_11400 [Sphingopyxis terrae]